MKITKVVSFVFKSLILEDEGSVLMGNAGKHLSHYTVANAR
jgi:hypothetical protein